MPCVRVDWGLEIDLADLGSGSRQLAAQALALVREGRALPEAFHQALQALPVKARPAPADQAFARRLAHAVLYARNRLDARLQPALKRPPKPAWVRELLLLGLVQLDDPDIPNHAALAATVGAAPQPLRGLINAVLRRASRGELELPPQRAKDPALAAGLPEWLYAALKKDWGKRLPELIAASNSAPPMGLRVHRGRAQREEVLSQLQDQGLSAEAIGPDGILLPQALPLEQLPAFAEGQVSVQNPSAQLAAALLPLQPGMRVLDACAAPGGKTAHMLEIEPGLELTALDADAERMQSLQRGLDRLGLKARCLSQPLQEHQDAAYEAILLDVPCSATGVMRRHPDIRWLRRPADLKALVQEQQALLAHAWTLLAPGGRLLYASCSLLRTETEDVVKAFVDRTADALPEPLELPAGESCGLGWRIPPGGAWDGFYYARLRRAPA